MESQVGGQGTGSNPEHRGSFRQTYQDKGTGHCEHEKSREKQRGTNGLISETQSYVLICVHIHDKPERLHCTAQGGTRQQGCFLCAPLMFTFLTTGRHHFCDL